MLADDETGAPLSISHSEAQTKFRSGIQRSRLDGLQHRSKQRALLSMAIFTGEDIAYHAVGRLIDDQGFPRQGAGLYLARGFEAPFARLKTVAINNFHAIPWQPGGTRTIKLHDQASTPQHYSAPTPPR